jgi:hypothetical protein
MSARQVYQEVYQILQTDLGNTLDPSRLTRLALLVTGIIGAKSASPARIASALHKMGLRAAKVESYERQIRRIENDPELTASMCVHPVARARLRFGRPQELRLIVDPTTQEDHYVLVSVAVWYRGRALPLAWAVWEANTPLTGARFWARLAALFAVVAELLPVGVPVLCLADRAFGTPAFTDLVQAHGWDYLVRVQDQTRCQTWTGTLQPVAQLVRYRGQRAKLRGWVFKKQGWRMASVVVLWGKRHRKPLCLVSSRPPSWALLHTYRRRYAIEAAFRDYKSHGWQWEQGQVKALAHLERLLVGMALATWLTVAIGAQVARELLAQPPTGRRYTRPEAGKYSLFTLGLERLALWLWSAVSPQPQWHLTEWEAPNWSDQIRQHHAYAFVWA